MTARGVQRSWARDGARALDLLHARSRNHFRPSSPEYREAARAITTELVARFAVPFVLHQNDHPVAVALPGASPVTDLLTGAEHAGELALAKHARVVLRPVRMETHP